ncbi:Protein SHI RELATED SEQUENCE 6 [Hirschfeldia incana]|nr:Protein SHI RELATED SEQUENCE 6 [Hirschfeldia incana]
MYNYQPSSSSTPFSAVASTVPDHSSTAGISTPDYMLGLRNTIFLPQPPSQIGTQPSPSPVKFAVVEENNKSSSRKSGNVEEKVCKDCGNRAKKETCCKSRGYNCPTHVKSTWVPSSAASRSSSSSSDRNKKLKLDSSDKPKSFLIVPTTTSRQQETVETSFKEGLPGKIEAPAVFRRTRVTAVSNNEQAEIGYQATVTISGHVFKGFLHYYGVDHNKAFPCLSNK